MAEPMTVQDLADLVEEFVVERDWAQFHSPKNLSMALSVEAAELMELFTWHTAESSTELMREGQVRTAAAEEIADVIIYAMALANRTGIDLAEAIVQKIEKNRKKYPVSEFKGRF